MMPLVATVVLGAGQRIVGEEIQPPLVDEVDEFADLAELGFIQVPDMDEEDFEGALLFDVNDAPEEMIKAALDAAATIAVAADV